MALVITADSSLHSGLLAVEPFRAANRLSKQAHYNVDIISVDGAALRTSLQIQVQATGSFQSDTRYDLVLIVISYEPAAQYKRKLFSWLRRQARFGAHICCIDYAPLLLAECGLLRGYTATAHWTTIEAFRDRYPDTKVVEQLYVVDRDRSTCAGQLSVLDYSLSMLEKLSGEVLARAVNNDLVYIGMRNGAAAQRRLINEDHWRGNPILARASELMIQAIEEPLTLETVARFCGVSLRELQYLFKRYLGRSPSDFYMELRLNRAKELLLYSGLSIRETGLACGFASESTFFRAFRGRFDTTPMKMRSTFHRAPATRDGRRTY
ncbi:GlxA family transcriptional regulator [Dongia sedimenti]|uniref:Helix-turn-helix domain-containing protein n=1 Tax=Dongia sedimenti TaxID=3064282 RepID=A0ABU0YPV6_9PROT|nr:helix-turn-helix domain-containing protein [Rhodospirillaceae bacterium R-7]